MLVSSLADPSGKVLCQAKEAEEAGKGRKKRGAEKNRLLAATAYDRKEKAPRRAVAKNGNER